MPKVYDCFCYFNEAEVLEIRLEELAPIVDVFVIVESRLTHTGAPKPLNLPARLDRLAPWRDRIRHVVFGGEADMAAASALHPRKRPSDARWAREWLQRHAILEGLADSAPEDFVIVSDLDEIPSREALAAAMAADASGRTLTVFEHSHHYNRLDWVVPGVRWRGARMIRRRWLKSPQLLRLTNPEGSRRDMPVLRDVAHRLRLLRNYGALLRPRLARGGWHLSAMGGPEEIAYKASQYLDHHAEQRRLEDAAEVRDRLANGLTHFGQKPERVPLGSLPSAVRATPARFAHLLSAQSVSEATG